MKYRKSLISLFIAVSVAFCLLAPTTVFASEVSAEPIVETEVVSVLEEGADEPVAEITVNNEIAEQDVLLTVPNFSTEEQKPTDTTEQQPGNSQNSTVQQPENPENNATDQPESGDGTTEKQPEVQAGTTTNQPAAGTGSTNSQTGNTTTNTITTTNTTTKTETVVAKKEPTSLHKSKYLYLNKESVSLEKGKKVTLKAKIQKKYQKKYKNKKIVYKTSNKKVATVNSKGVVTAKGKGTCYITATIKGTKYSVKTKVTVKNYITKKVKTTAYCGCKKCNGKWYGQPTASGKKAKSGRTIAVDKKVIKLGTKVKIGDTVYIAEDTGVKGNHIDIYFDSHKKALKYGVKYKKVKIYI